MNELDTVKGDNLWDNSDLTMSCARISRLGV